MSLFLPAMELVSPTVLADTTTQVLCHHYLDHHKHSQSIFLLLAGAWAWAL